MSPRPFTNNLRKGDPVLDVRSGRRGVVQLQPRETSFNVCVLLDGLTTARYFPVTDLRFIVNGIAEDVPPVDGEIPAHATPPPTSKHVESPIPPPPTSLDGLIAQRRALTLQLLDVEDAIARARP